MSTTTAIYRSLGRLARCRAEVLPSGAIAAAVELQRRGLLPAFGERGCPWVYCGCEDGEYRFVARGLLWVVDPIAGTCFEAA